MRGSSLFYESNSLHLPYNKQGGYGEDLLERNVKDKMESLRKRGYSSREIYDRISNYYSEEVTGNRTLERMALRDYDKRVRRTDTFVRNLTRLLEKHGYRENTVVVFTSQHGELLGHENMWGHHGVMDKRLLEVPLIIYVPPGKQARIERRVSLVDLPHTVLDILDVDRKEMAEQGLGESLVPLMRKESAS